MNIILGSQSPRRRELLRGLDIPHSEVSIDADESYPADLRGGDIPMYISRAKAEAYARTHEFASDDLLITSDTIVWLDGCVLGKPHSTDDAKRMLRLLSGKTHQVYTAVTFAHRTNFGVNRMQSEADYAINYTTQVDCCDVTFLPLRETDIDYYVNQYQPMDKAGAYGIQEWIGYIGVSSINGSFYTVMGFPTHLVHNYLEKYTEQGSKC